MSAQVLLMNCLLVGGPFDGMECEEVKGTLTIAVRAGPGAHFAIYSRRETDDADLKDKHAKFSFDRFEDRKKSELEARG